VNGFRVTQMVRAVAEAPHVTALFEADFSAVAAHKAAMAVRGLRLSYTAYIVKAAAEAMAVAPAINGRWEKDRISISPTIDVGVGTALGEHGINISSAAVGYGGDGAEDEHGVAVDPVAGGRVATAGGKANRRLLLPDGRHLAGALADRSRLDLWGSRPRGWNCPDLRGTPAVRRGPPARTRGQLADHDGGDEIDGKRAPVPRVFQRECLHRR